MSGALSIPFALLGLYLQNSYARDAFAALAYLALWALVFKKGIQHKREISDMDSRLKLSEAQKTPLLEEVASLKLQFDEREKRKQARVSLSAYLSRLENRITEINQMRPSRYIESINDTPEEAAIATTYHQYKERIYNLNDKISFALLGEIHDWLEALEKGKGTLFLSHTGIEFSGRSDNETIDGIQANKQALILDHLRHRARNLLALIKDLG